MVCGVSGQLGAVGCVYPLCGGRISLEFMLTIHLCGPGLGVGRNGAATLIGQSIVCLEKRFRSWSHLALLDMMQSTHVMHWNLPRNSACSDQLTGAG